MRTPITEMTSARRGGVLKRQINALSIVITATAIRPQGFPSTLRFDWRPHILHGHKIAARQLKMNIRTIALVVDSWQERWSR